MSVDHYAVCPCGSGKKIKFCKCSDSVAELDRVWKMIDGGQIVPALDRLSEVLTEHPDAAWALAIRGRLFLDLREYDKLAENAERFIRLQPSNPLALTQRAASEAFRGDLETATGSILEALTESGRDVDSFVMDVASALAYFLAQTGNLLTARTYASLTMMAQDYEGSEMANQLLRQLNQSPAVSQLLKSVPKEIPRPADAPDWGERYDEAAGLLRSNKVTLAESKLESIRRVAPNEPAVLSGLFLCSVWRGDVSAQRDLLRKLSACESLDFETRVRNLALSCLIDPADDQLATPCYKISADIENAEETEIAMTADSRFVALPAEMLAEMRESEDEVPPRAAFQILDRDKPETTDGLPPVEEIPESIATVLVYGKQTDRSARVESFEIYESKYDEVTSLLKSILGDTVELKKSDAQPTPLLTVSQPSIAIIRFKAKPEEADTMQRELLRSRGPMALASAKFNLLGNASLIDVADDDSKLLQRTAVVRAAEQYDALAKSGSEVLGKVYELAKLEPLGPLVLSDDEIEDVNNADLNRVDPSNLNEDSCMYLLQRAQMVSATPATERLANRLISMDLTDDKMPAKMVAYQTLVNAASGPKQALERLNDAHAFADQHQFSVPSLLLTELSLRLQTGDGEGFQKAIEKISSRYGNDPEVMGQVQQLLMKYGLIRPDGSPRSASPQAAPVASEPAPGGPAAAGGGLWTPDSPSGPTPDTTGEGGGSKLWVPGMD